MKSRFFNSLAITLLFLAACTAAVGSPTGAGALPIKATAVPLNPADPAQDQVGRLLYRGGFRLTSPDKRFGGLSGLHVSANGERMIAMSDNGRWVSAKLLYDKDNLAGVTDGVLKPIKKLKGYHRHGNWTDAESLAQDGSGGFYVSFEHLHRIWHYPAHPTDPIDADPEPLNGPAGFESQPLNGGVEALTRLCDRRLLAISEEAPGTEPGTKKAWFYDGQSWKALNYRTTGKFRVSGATTLPDCNLAILERSYTRREGPRVRVLYLPAATIRAGATLQGEELATLARPLTVDNMEGIAARRDHGKTLLYLISDDNFSRRQRTLLMMFELLPPPEKKK